MLARHQRWHSVFSGCVWSWSTTSRRRTDIWLFTHKSQPSLSQTGRTCIRQCKTDWCFHSDAASSVAIVNLHLLQPDQEQSSHHLHKINHLVNLLKIRLSAWSLSKGVRKTGESSALSSVSSSYPPLNFPPLWQDISEVSSMTLWTDLYKTVTQSALTYWQKCISCKPLKNGKIEK